MLPTRGFIAAVLAGLVAMLGTASCSSENATDTPSTSKGSATTTVKGESGTFTALAYNVAGLPAEVSKENPVKHLPLISPKLSKYDVVLTQEDFDWWTGIAATLDFVHYHERLREHATQKYKTAAHPGPEAVHLDLTQHAAPIIGDGQGIMSNFSFTDEQRVPWVGCFGGFDQKDGGAADCLAMKGFAVVTMTLSSGVVVDVYSLHVEAGGTETDQKLQAADVQQLAAFINAHSAGRAVIVGGDTNLHTDSGHPDASAGSNLPDDTELWNTFLKDAGLTDACVATKCSDTSRIDKFAYRSSDAVTIDATAYDVPAADFVDESGDDLSDHEPLVVTFKWTTLKAG